MGICPVEVGNLEKRYAYLQNSLQQLLKENINDLTEHQLHAEESNFLADSFIHEKIIQHSLDIDSLYRKRDELLFSQYSNEERSEKYEAFSSSILDKEQALQEWQDKDSHEIVLPETLSIEYQNIEQTPADSQFSYFMEKNSLDMLICGTVERLDDLFFLELSCYKQTSPEAVFIWSGTGPEDQLNILLDEATDELRTELLGRSWAALRVEAQPKDSLIMLDGKTIGVGDVFVRAEAPGYKTLKISRGGYESLVKQIYLPSMKFMEFSVALEKGVEENFYFLSEPPGADVYFGSQWMGTTPFYSSKPDFNNNVKISLDGFAPFQTPSWKLEGESITVQLSRLAYDKQDALDTAKKRFYRSLGWLSISMALPLVMYGIYQNQYSMYYNYANDWTSGGIQADYDKAMDSYDSSELTYKLFLGGLAVSGGLLVNTLFKLKNYINAAEESTAD